jgi:ankyrin repeat protein
MTGQTKNEKSQGKEDIGAYLLSNAGPERFPGQTDEELKQILLDGALQNAVARGDPERAESLIEAGANPKGKNGAGMTLLMLAAAGGDAATVRKLAPKSDIDAKDEDGVTALMLATRSAFASSLSALLDAGADPRAVDGRGRSALAWAMRRGAVKEAELLAPLSDLGQKDSDGATLDELAGVFEESGFAAMLQKERAARERIALLGAADEALPPEETTAVRKPRAL